MNIKRDDDSEMSMEEILASIRRYVSEDGHESHPAVRNPPPKNADVLITPSYSQYQNDFPKPEVSLPENFSKYDSMQSNVNLSAEPIKLTEAFEAPNPSNFHTYSPTSSYVSSKTFSEKQDLEGSPLYESSPISSINEDILSNKTRHASANAFSRLADTVQQSTFKEENKQVKTASGLTLEHLMIELARPMVKEWLDNNLSQMVENLINKEIERINKNILQK